ncbi:hypothetical protein [Allobranchiibius sp. GilTou38]|uniref:hypothetical protein n=1 Tax=Allobranchiibius sp. GilTou38 TaxID=2815210 RepID=UPI001AA0ED6C|nr:hypothetical protein [Allobranchiibius sp. GilTou38]MBO1765775.1 hypothetical protein [Allobranchiibius sp. GilTou38]
MPDARDLAVSTAAAQARLAADLITEVRVMAGLPAAANAMLVEAETAALDAEAAALEIE